MRRGAVTLDEYDRGVETMVSMAEAIVREWRAAAAAKDAARAWRIAKRRHPDLEKSGAASRSRGGQARARQERAEKAAREARGA